MKFCLGSYEQVKELLGNVTVVVNNAGIAQEVNWTKSVDINLVRFRVH